MASSQLRTFIYALPVGTLAAGEIRREVELKMDLDSEFILRSRAVHYASLTPGLAGQSALVDYFDRYTASDTGDYLGDALLRLANECPDFGQYGSPLPLRPPVRYPRGASLLADVQNQGETDYTDLVLYFIGQKVFQPGVLPCNVQPANASPFPFIYSRSVSIGQQQNLLNNKLDVLNDADFIIRSLTIGSMNISDSLSQYYEMFILLKDQDSRPYSNIPVHVDACYGAFGSIVGVSQQPTFRTGPYHPGLIAPEIYQPANTFLYYDLYRRDNYINGPGFLSTVDLKLAFNGMKVFHR